MNSNPTHRTALLQVARLSDMREDWQKAVQEYQGLADLYPGDPFILESLAKAQQKMGMKETSILTLAKAADCYSAWGLIPKAAHLRARLYELTIDDELPVAVLA